MFVQLFEVVDKVVYPLGIEELPRSILKLSTYSWITYFADDL